MRILALDVGEKRIGVALSDPSMLIATPLVTIMRKGESIDLDEVLKLANSHQVGEIIVGYPVSLSGHIGHQAQKVAAFISDLSARSTIPVKLIDERFSSVEAERLLRQSGIKPSRDKARVDAVAAAVLLQSHLDSSQ